MSDEETLLGFGFPEERVKAALSATNNGGLDAALNWLEANPNDSGISENSSTNDDKTNTDIAPEEAVTEEAQSIVCNECAKLFKNEDHAQFHAVKSGHTDFAQSTQAIKPLTEEEKKQKLDELQIKLKEKRAKAEEEEKKRQRENEIIRRKAGKDQSENQERLKEQQMKRELAEQQRIKREDQEAARRIKLQIEQNRKDRAARIAQEKAERENAGSANIPSGDNTNLPSMINAGLPKVSTEGSTQARLQIRPMLQSASEPVKPLTHTFSADQTLKDVFKFVKEQIPHLGRHIKLSTTFPRKDFSTHHESKTLKELGLVPNAALILTE
ncbi:hypothetical protein COEREDRAFT_76151 [Coemansia reversa NRRL 1564]|uniref:UBX-domain-containing protein n=1 Tax=Coemansia reversa (strain ATCC 12441 / NRRL 1564) TaxID=763665 RepID=A0A2G5B6G9_COERN|nr:hypothetical protein COEREDRAFT_76151 [Coemansia reversa NRRL 1564]|eukprot:PIA14590.1 hypothetical protein COEREDRAFT_76151 [Coemansia reversa NRRL 1564]